MVMIDKLKETFFINSFSVELIEPKTLPHIGINNNHITSLTNC